MNMADTSVLRPLAWQGPGKCRPCMFIKDLIMGSTTCSDPGFYSPPTFVKAWETGKRQFLYVSRSIVHPNGTSQTANHEPLALFLPISNDVQALLRCASTVYVMVLFGLRGRLPILVFSTCFSAFSTCFSIQSAERG